MIDGVERAIEATTEVQAPFDSARAVLLTDAVDTVEPAAYPGMVIEVEAPAVVGGGDGETIVVPLWWRATGFERLFPVFEGSLELVRDGAVSRLNLRGRYVVPLGAMGRFGDGVVGRRVARRTAAGLMETIAVRIVERAGRSPTEAEQPTPAPPLTMVRDLESDAWPTRVPSSS